MVAFRMPSKCWDASAAGACLLSTVNFRNVSGGISTHAGEQRKMLQWEPETQHDVEEVRGPESTDMAVSLP